MEVTFSLKYILVPNRRLRFRRMSFRGCVLFGYVFVRYVMSGYPLCFLPPQ